MLRKKNITIVHPDWAIIHKRKGTELRFLNGTYYLYEVSSKWDAEIKRSRKITGKLLGKITKEQGFVPSKSRRRSLVIKDEFREILKGVVVKEFGLSYLINNVLQEPKLLLKRHFPDIWEKIIALVYCRLDGRFLVKNYPLLYEQSYLSKVLNESSFSSRQIGSLFRSIGSDSNSINSFYSEFRKSQGCILFTTQNFQFANETSISNCSTSNFATRPLDSTIAFSSRSFLPVFAKVTSGEFVDASFFKKCKKESRLKTSVVVADQSRFSIQSIAEMVNEDLDFILPLNRESPFINYSPILKGNKAVFEGNFDYEGCSIYYYSIELDEFNILVYLDLDSRKREEKAFAESIDSNGHSYTAEMINKQKASFGTVSLLNNLKKTPKQVYADYRTRHWLENYMKSHFLIRPPDYMYFPNLASIEGWLFVNVIALQLRLKIYELLKNNNLASKYDVSDVISLLTEVRKVNVGNLWFTSDLPSKSFDFLDSLGLAPKDNQ